MSEASNQSDTLSVTSSSSFDSLSDVLGGPLPEGFKIIGNRWFNTKTKYILPSDASESDRLDTQHFFVKQLIHGNFQSPVEELLEQGIKVLDVGCGSGCWILEMARDYPNSTFIGVDAAEVFPKEFDLPNCSFMGVDVLNGLPFEDETFTFVFQRFLVYAFSPEDWKKDIQELARVTKPGGWVELLDAYVVLERPPPYNPITQAAIAMCTSRGIDVEYVWELKNLLLANNFDDIASDYISIPLNWGGRVGELYGRSFLIAWAALEPFMAPYLKMTKEEFQTICELTLKWYAERKSWFKAPYAFGRKAMKP